MTRTSLMVLAIALGSMACSKKSQEPEKDPRFAPSSADAAARSASPSAPSSLSSTPKDAGAPDTNALTPKERRDVVTRIDNTQCETAAKHANVVNGRGETDPQGIDLLSGCLKWGNVAWYVCMTAAKTPETLKRCNERLLLPQD